MIPKTLAKPRRKLSNWSQESARPDSTPDKSSDDVLRAGYRTRAEALARLGEQADAEADWDRMVAKETDGAGKEADKLLGPAMLAAWAGDATRAVQLAEAAAESDEPSPLQCYCQAKVLAHAAQAADSEPEVEAYALKAVQWLERARQGGHLTKTSARVLNGRVFQGLRDREDFKNLQQQLAETAQVSSPR